MDHIAAALFFTILFLGTGTALHMLVRDYWSEITAALRGEHHVRSTIYRYRARVRPAALARCASAPMRHAAS